jgi:hypothetical protein
MRGGQYLYTNFSHHGVVNLYPVGKTEKVEINGEIRGASHTYGRGALPNYPDGNTVVMAEMPDVIHNWPHKWRKILVEYDKAEWKHDTNAFAKALDESYKYHEAIHMHLDNLFPHLKRTMGRRYSVSRSYPLAPNNPNLNMKIGGNITIFEIHELCAVGAQMAKAKDPHVALLYFNNPTPVYKMAIQALFYVTLKKLPDSSPVKRKYLEQLGVPDSAVDVNMGEITEFFQREKDPTLLNKVGEEMWNMGIDLMESVSRS